MTCVHHWAPPPKGIAGVSKNLIDINFNAEILQRLYALSVRHGVWWMPIIKAHLGPEYVQRPSGRPVALAARAIARI